MTTYKKVFRFASIVAVIAIVALMFSLGLGACTAAYADDMQYQPGGANTGTIDVSYHEYSSFGVSVPLTVNVGEEYSIKLEAVNLEDGYKVNISVSNLDDESHITLTHTKDNTCSMKCTIMNSTGGFELSTLDSTLATFTASDIIQDGVTTTTTPSTFVINKYADFGSTAKAGTYTGQICYRVDCFEVSE